MTFKFLTGRQLRPITNTVGFIEIDARVATDAFVDWLAPIYEKNGVTLEIHACTGTLEQVLRQLLPLTSHQPRRTIFVPKRSPWTAYFDSGWRGGDPASRVSFLSEYKKCRGIRAVSVPHTLDEGQQGEHGAVMFELYGPEPNPILNIIRAISVTHDGSRWEFEASGEVQPFEDTSAYKARRITERFTPEMLSAYLMSLGIDAFNEDFYVASPENPAFRIEMQGLAPADMKEYPLPDEA